MSKMRRPSFLRLGLLMALTTLFGCKEASEKLSRGESVTVVVRLSEGSGTGTRTGGVPDTEPGPSTGPGAPLPPPPDGDTPPPTPENPGARGNVSVSSQEGLRELSDRYGVTVTGSFGDHEVSNVLTSARQLRPEETANLRVYYPKGNRRRGVMGMYTANGRITCFDHKTLHTVFHEIMHHITLYRRNRRARSIAKEVLAMVPPAQGSLRNADPAYIPRSYAQVNSAEFYAEFFTYLREKEKGLKGGYPCSRRFNPDESVRRVARTLFASP